MVKDIVVIGASHAGIQVASSLREMGYGGTLTVLGAERQLPYQRPPLSKDFMLDPSANILPLRGEKFFVDNDVDLRLGCRATEIDRVRRRVVVDDGSELRYDVLVIATGSRNKHLGVFHGAVDAPVLDLRTADDAIALRKKLGEIHRAVVIGAGFVGLEFAAAARSAGVDVDVLEFTDRPMARVLSPAMSKIFYSLHVSDGVQFYMGEGAAGIEQVNDGGCGVRTTGGRLLPAELVLCSVGAQPNTELAEAAGLEVRDGIVVDAHLRTKDPCIWAIGDCVRYFNRYAGGWVRLESVQNAVDQARHAAEAILGSTAGYDDVPWFWTIQGHSKLQIAGIYDQGDLSVTCQGATPDKCSVFSFRGGKLSAVESLGQPADHMAARKLLAVDNGITAGLVATQGFDLKSYWKAMTKP